ncbi:uncharacterized protein LOC120837646 [Ixodes scapularis]|uniref:uncharacterized protein LOC120837646 n=1 Tax=Ixodes scapularis TaxID=6945 RepID=UPI001A9FD922|nr:uncharacterized protein LOC120837646 [Ixodes scapularis]
MKTKILLALLTVVLISTTVEKGVSSLDIAERGCLSLVAEGGDIICDLNGHKMYTRFNGGNCSLGCFGGNFWVRLPDGVCSVVGLKECTDEVKTILIEWKAKLKVRLLNTKEVKCPPRSESRSFQD